MAAPDTGRLPRLSETFRDALSGDDMGRIFGLTDGVFGFAMTFLVVNLVIPVDCELSPIKESCVSVALWGEGYLFIAYAFSFFVLGIWWVRHHGLLKHFARYDAALLWTNLLFCLMIAITPFILGVFGDFVGVEVSVILFASVEAAAGFLLVLIWEIGVRASLLKPDVNPLLISRSRSYLWIAPAIFVVSGVAAVFSVTVAHIIWAALFVEIALGQLSGTHLMTRRKPSKAA